MIPTVIIEGVRVPQFDQMTPEKWDLALQHAFDEADQLAKHIQQDLSAPSFDNTFLALERRSQVIKNTLGPFMCSQTAHNTPEMQALAEKWTAPFDEQTTRLLDKNLAERCKTVQQQLRENANTDPIDQRLADETTELFAASGAYLNAADRDQLLAIRNRLTALGLEFSATHQSNSAVCVWVNDLSGLDEAFIQQAKTRAEDEGKSEQYGVLMMASEVEAVLSGAHDRATRETAWRAFNERGLGNRDQSTQALVQEMLTLRQNMAELLGFDHWADFATSRRMAQNAKNAEAMIDQTWVALQPILNKDMADLTLFAQQQGHPSTLEGWDLDYWLNRKRAQDFSIDEDMLRDHLSLPVVRQAAFDTAQQLFGITFEAVDAPLYHADASAYLVRSEEGQSIGLLYVDDRKRPTKTSGAWMEEVYTPNRFNGTHLPVVVNVCNFPDGTAERPALLSMDEAVTAFHELGHGLHALLSTARYPSLAGVNVRNDFVELQSQLLENWIKEPEALQHFAKHWETGEPLPEGMAEQIATAQHFGQSFYQARYLLSAKVDMVVHQHPYAKSNPVLFEQSVISQYNGPTCLVPRHHLTHFTHLFAGALTEGYSAGYYAYLWAEVLEADVFEAFQESGKIWNAQLGQKARDTFYARGNEVEPMALFEQFRGRHPTPEALLRRMKGEKVTPRRSHSMSL